MKQNWKSWLPLGGMLFALYLAIHYWTPFCRLAQLGLQAAAPLLLGAVMAYAVNILMSMLESRLFPRGGSLSRPVLAWHITWMICCVCFSDILSLN